MRRSSAIEAMEDRKMLSAVIPGGDVALNPGPGSDYGYDADADAAGNLVVVQGGVGADRVNVRASRFDRDGNALGETLVNQTSGTAIKKGANVDVAADGRFVVSWFTTDSGTMRSDVYVRRFGASGQPLGAEVKIQADAFLGANPKVAVDDAGGSVLVWKSARSRFSNDWDIWVQRFDPAGQKVGKAVRANASAIYQATYGYFGPGGSLDADADGDFVVTWNAPDRDGSGWGVYGQRFRADGAKQGGEFRVNSTTAGDQAGWDNVSMGTGGDFVVVWEDYGGVGGPDVYAQRYDASGVAVGGEFRVNADADGGQSMARVDVGRDGNTAISWQDSRGDVSVPYVQAYDAAGAAIGGNVQMNNAVGADAPLVVMKGGGEFLVTWRRGDLFGSNFVIV